MGLLDRFKKKETGIEELVLILEGSTIEKRIQILEQIREEDSEYAAMVEEKFFLWDNLFTLPLDTLSIILPQVQLNSLVTALAELEPSRKQILIDSLDEKLKQRVLENLNYVGHPTTAMINSSRRKIVATARELEKSGKIT